MADEFKNNFLVKKAEIVSLKLNIRIKLHFLKRRISVDNFRWHVELDQRYVECLLDAMAMNESLQIDGHSWIEGKGEVTKCGRFD